MKNFVITIRNVVKKFILDILEDVIPEIIRCLKMSSKLSKLQQVTSHGVIILNRSNNS